MTGFDESVMVVLVVFGSILLFVKILVDSKIRSKLIDKGMVDENIKYLSGTNVPASLKWGMVLTSMGLAFFIGLIFPEEIRGEVTFGSMFILGGIALIIYYLMVHKKQTD
ncbi:hypothetical protein J7K93_12105 [bacterium]|nr:hypothetical protein [bacterium]